MCMKYQVTTYLFFKFQTLRYIAVQLGAIRSDILGLKKEISRNEKGNTIMFKILVEKKSVDVVLQEILSLHDTIFRDYVLLRKAVFAMFRNSGQDDFKKLKHYIELLGVWDHLVSLYLTEISTRRAI